MKQSKRSLAFLLAILLLGVCGIAADIGSGGSSDAPAETTALSATYTVQPFFTNLPENRATENATVFITTDISAEGMMAVYEALNWKPAGKVAVKLSTGEPPASNYLQPELIHDVVKAVDGTIVECNTAYGGSRAQTAMHYQVAKDHGFTDIADFQILDENGSMTLQVNGGSVLTENYVGSAFADYDSYLILSHFKGHSMAGFGGAIKNISIGLGSSEGKAWIHSGGTSRTNAWGGRQDAFLEAMAEAGKSVADYLENGKGIVYINVMNRLSVDCDCDGHPSEPDMHDIGILASTDPVALDQACIDLIYSASDGQSLINRIESRNGLHTLEHAEKIGLGSRAYTLVNMDDAAIDDAIIDVALNQSAADVTLRNRTHGTLVGAVYGQGGQMIDLAMTQVSANCGGATLSFPKKLPDSCEVKIMLVDSSSWKPLCESLAISYEAPATDDETSITLSVGGQTFSTTLLKSESARQFAEMLPLTLNMLELNGNEKYFYLDDTLPTAPYRPGQIHAGDLMLYGNSCLVLFYETFSSGYSYTPLGSVDDPTGLAEALGAGNVTITFEE